ncbi:butyrate kinase [Bacteroidetes/Chlorobi group bacterium Naka2016]|jgi:butyrate kinase|nr:MAG: butyrate kinase [Bacteroidetes/Chlorobi group bacterium Naka2016]
MNYYILSINPGSTSTKVALFRNLEEDFTVTVRHSVDELKQFLRIFDQYEFRKKVVLDALEKAKINLKEVNAVVGRGGLVRPIPSGVYRINQKMLDDLRNEINGEHASNLGAILAFEIAKEIGPNVPCFIVDPVVVDELDDIARISGHPELPRISIFHALNQKAVSRRFAREQGKKYEELNLIVVHLGGGITVGVHHNGRVIDVNNGLDGEGPFSPERSGTLPVGQLARLCFSGKYTFTEVRKMITGRGGLVAYLGTNNALEVEERIACGDDYAELIYKAMAYQIAKEIGAASTVLKGNVDAILITGGLANSPLLVKWIQERVYFIAPIFVYPGEDEMFALAEGVYYALKGEIPIKDY